MKPFCVLVCGLLALGFCSYAQPPVGGDAPAAPEATAAPEAAAPQATAEAPGQTPAASSGDVITLKNGKKVIGQVLKRTPRDFEVEIVQGVTLTIPRKQIESVEYDDLEPRAGASQQAPPGETGRQDLIPGRKLSSELYEKLTTDISNPPVKYENKDLLEAADELGKRFGVTITVEDPVKQLPIEKRRWTCDTTAGATLLMLLEDDLQAKLPDVKVVFQYGKILLTTRDAAASSPAETPPAAAPVTANP